MGADGHLRKSERSPLLVLERDAAESVSDALDPAAILESIVTHAARIRPEASAHAVVLEVDGHFVRVVAGRRPDGSSDGIAGGGVPLRLADQNLPRTDEAWTWRVGDLGAPAAAAAARAGVVHGAAAAFHGPGRLHLLLATADPRPFTAEELGMLESLARLATAALENARVFQRLAFLAGTDELTGLPNRRSLDGLLALPQERALAILAIDVDNLKRINDRRGHAAGDTALRAVAAALGSCLREGDLVARTGGDEFVAVLFGAGGDDALRVAERMRETVRTGSSARISIGIAVATPPGDITAARHAADEALYTAKTSGRDRIVAHERHSDRRQDLLGEWAAALDTVMAGRGLFAVYQPIVHLPRGAVVGYTAQVRPLVGAVGMSVAGMFDAARQLGVLRQLDWEARRTALTGAADVPPGLPLFVKSATATLLDPRRDSDAMADLVAAAGRSPGDVVIEVPSAFRDPVPYLDVLDHHRAKGFGVAVSGFGNRSGLSLEGLARVAPEYVKVPVGSLSRERLSALGEVSVLGAAAPTTVVGEQLATLSDVARAAELGVEHVQGFAVGRLSRRPQSQRELDLPRLPLPWRAGAPPSDDRSGSER